MVARLVVVAEPGRHGPPGKHGHGPREGFTAGEVTAIDGSSFTIDPFWGDDQTTVQTDENTEYRTRSGEDVSFDDIAVGGTVMAKGQPVDGAENTILAEVIGIKK